MAETDGQGGQRLDAWLWCARLAKTRSLCAQAVERGGFRLNRQPTEKPHARIRPGDVITFPWGPRDRGEVRIWRVLALAERRGPPAAARLLFEDLSATGE